MSLENTLDRIAVALEKIAGGSPAALKVLSHPATEIEARESAAAQPSADAKPERVVRLARSVATDPGVVREAAAATTTRVNDRPVSNGQGRVVSFDDMKNALVGVKAKFGADVSRGIMQKVGAGNVQEIKPEDFGKVIAECSRAMSG